MSRFARIVLCTAALVLWLAALPLVSTGQQASLDSQGGSVTTITPKADATPKNTGTIPAIPEGTVTIYSNLALSYSYYKTQGWTESGATSGVHEAFIQAIAFKPRKGTYRLTQIDLAITYNSGTDGYTLELRGDDHGQPGRLIASWPVTGLPIFGASSMGLNTIKVNEHVILWNHVQYWLVPVVNSDEWAVWNQNSLNPAAEGKMAVSTDGEATWTTWTTADPFPLGAFDVLGVRLF
jgi:hypothetical protein